MYKLIVESPVYDDIETVIIEEKNTKGGTDLFIKGPYMMANQKNKNDRMYPMEEMVPEVDRYVKEMIKPKRALGELNHPTSAEVDLERACHLVTELAPNGDYFMGKSKILSTPMGQITKNLILDGVTVGMSTRALGKLEESNGTDVVSEMRLIAIDCVADPSCPTAFVNGILESKSFIIGHDGKYEESYATFENGIASLPKHNINEHLKEQIITFLGKLGKI